MIKTIDKKALKASIVEYREKGLSYTDICDLIEKDFGIEMSRQSVYAMYKRAKSDKNIEKNKKLHIARPYIIRYSILGYKPSEIKEIIKRVLESDISVSDIAYAIEEAKASGQYNGMLDEEIELVRSLVQSGEDLVTFVNKLTFMGVKPTPSACKQLLSEYVAREIKLSKARIIGSVMNLVNNDYFIKQLIAENEGGVTIKEVQKASNE